MGTSSRRPTSATPHILIVDDEPDIREPLARVLKKHGFRTSIAADGKQCRQVLGRSAIDLIVLDIMMPEEDGLSICRRLVETTTIPIILLTALAEETDRIVGLELGADDYVTKPFNPRELVARVRSVLRRTERLPPRLKGTKGVARFGQWRFDLSRHEVTGADGVSVRLSTGERKLLVALVEHAGLTLTRDQLLDLTRGREAQLFDRSVDNQVSRLRRKLEADSGSPEIIVTEWGGGYRFAAELEWIS